MRIQAKHRLQALIPLAEYLADGQDQQHRQQDGPDGQHVHFLERAFLAPGHGGMRRRRGSFKLCKLHGSISTHHDDDHNPGGE